MAITKSLLNTPPDATPDTEITVNGSAVPARVGELLVEVLNRHSKAQATKQVPQVCYLPQMGPIQSCDTCMVQVSAARGGATQLVRACATRVTLPRRSRPVRMR